MCLTGGGPLLCLTGGGPLLCLTGCMVHYCASQEVVPDELMESYLSMTEQVKAQVVDTDLPYYCAYSLPGVALTLGHEYWDIVRPTFSLLASDMQVHTHTPHAANHQPQLYCIWHGNKNTLGPNLLQR